MGNDDDGAAVEVEEDEEDPVRLNVDIALNEDLTCEYKRSKMSSCSVEGTVQVRFCARCFFRSFVS